MAHVHRPLAGPAWLLVLACESNGGQPPPQPPASDCRLGAELLAIVNERFGASAIAVDATRVYLKTRRGVLAVLKTGGTLEPPPPNVVPPALLASDRAADETHDYTFDDTNLFRVRREAGAAPELLRPHGESECTAVAVDGQHLYWTGASGVVRRTEKVHPGIAIFVGGAGASDCDDDYDGIVLAVDDTSVYWTAGEPRRRTSDEEPLRLMKTCK